MGSTGSSGGAVFTGLLFALPLLFVLLLLLFLLAVEFFLDCAMEWFLSLAYGSEYHGEDDGQHAHDPAVIGEAAETALDTYVF